MASHLNEATSEDVLAHNEAVQLMRDTAAQYLTTWKHDLKQVVAMTASDAAGIGTEGPVQNAWLAGVADPQLATGEPTRVSVLS